jgi:hypothetical protein
MWRTHIRGLALVAHAYHPRYSGGPEIRKMAIGSQPRQMVHKKPNTKNRAGVVTQVVEHLPRKLKARVQSPELRKK